jgi:competence protein ComEA
MLGRPMDINRATLEELQLLPGIGPRLAGRIAGYRQRHGPMASVADLQRVQGIGPVLSARLAPLISFE